jgi:hypothetical protein
MCCVESKVTKICKQEKRKKRKEKKKEKGIHTDLLKIPELEQVDMPSFPTYCLQYDQ